jgi:hypothetical protein
MVCRNSRWLPQDGSMHQCRPKPHVTSGGKNANQGPWPTVDTMEYFRDSQTECRRVQRLQPPPPLPAFYPPTPSLIDGLIGMFEMRQQSLLSDSFNSPFLGSFRVLDWRRSSQARRLFPLMLFIEGGPKPQLSFKRDWAGCRSSTVRRERYQFDWWDRVGG